MGDGVVAEQTQQGRGVQARGLEQRLAPGAAELGGGRAVRDATARDDVPHEGVAVGVQTAGGQRQHDVAAADTVGPEHAVGLDDARRRPRDVVVVDAEETGVLGVSPPTRAVPVAAQPRAIPATMSAMRVGTTLPHAM